MAGDTSPVVNKWILDYYTYYAWEEFKRDRTISSSTLDSISGILSKTWEGDEQGNDKKLFLTILSRLKDGSDIHMRYDESCDDTPLEDLIPHFTNLVYLQIDNKLQKEGELLFTVIKYEAVQACCRAGEFEKAQEVFDRLQLQKMKDKKYTKMAKGLKDQIKERDKETEMSYDGFVTAMIEYLQLIADSFEEPTIVAAAKVFMEKQVCHHNKNDKDSESQSIIPDREILDELEKSTHGNKNNNNSGTKADKERLRKLWDYKIKDMFGDESPPEKKSRSARSGVSKSPCKEPPTSSGAVSRTSTPKKDGSGSFKVPSEKPSSADGSQSRTSTPKKKDGSGSFKVPSKKPTTADGSHSRTSTPKKPGSEEDRSPFKQLTTSRGSSLTPKKSGPVSTVSPVQRPSLAERYGEDSPEFRYRKNKGRIDRHEPVMSSTRCSYGSEAGDNISEMEVSSVYGSRKRKWTNDEMLEFYDAVNTFGVGKWAQIKEYLNTTRTGVMLKDKWRNMIKYGEVDKIREKRKKKK
ncbi:telomeric repeat-binding factor 2-like [Mercenaria mercenaria]|uniref:telomeric repeat-binding factor 2-like n=1 Tax=Mercenaria mercenaria TaxID=6596 RepID=UPI00234EDFC5|nr:telomeric repeat-binding factor 2-like [Mercenaria mercenaria]